MYLSKSRSWHLRFCAKFVKKSASVNSWNAGVYLLTFGRNRYNVTYNCWCHYDFFTMSARLSGWHLKSFSLHPFPPMPPPLSLLPFFPSSISFFPFSSPPFPPFSPPLSSFPSLLPLSYNPYNFFIFIYPSTKHATSIVWKKPVSSKASSVKGAGKKFGSLV